MRVKGLFKFHLLTLQHKNKNLYAKYDARLAPSRLESYNLTARKAVAYGAPPVLTYTGWPMGAIKSYEMDY